MKRAAAGRLSENSSYTCTVLLHVFSCSSSDHNVGFFFFGGGGGGCGIRGIHFFTLSMQQQTFEKVYFEKS